MRSLVTSIFLYACESWSLTAELQRRIQAIEMRCYRKILHKDNVTNEEVLCQDPLGNQTKPRPPDHRKEMQTAVVWSYLPFIRSGQNHLAGTVKGGRRQGRQRKRWEDNIREWTGLEFTKSQRAMDNTRVRLQHPKLAFIGCFFRTGSHLFMMTKVDAVTPGWPTVRWFTAPQGFPVSGPTALTIFFRQLLASISTGTTSLIHWLSWCLLGKAQQEAGEYLQGL